MYVVAIDLDIEKTDYKAFSVKADAEERSYSAWLYETDGKAITTDSGDVYVNTARLYEVDAADPIEAIDLVKARKGHVMKDTANPFPDLKINLQNLRFGSKE